MYEKIDKSVYTPMMQQYLTIKEGYPDTLVFFRLGDFYEMFFNDAITASKELEIVLTERDAGVDNEPVPMCGVPFHAVDAYIEKLSEKGYKVAIVEQMDLPSTKKIVKREVIRVITPGTNVDEGYLDDKSNCYLGAIEYSSTGYLFAYIDLSIGSTQLTILPNHIEAVYNELLKLNIKEIVVNSRFNHNYLEYLKNNLGIVISIEDDYKIDDYMNELINDLSSEQKIIAGRLLNYVIKTQKRVLVHLKPFNKYTSNEFLRIDANSIKNLELIESLRNNKSKKNLFGVLDHCQTAMGSRYLKRSIIFPLTSLDKINHRLDIITELSKNYLQNDELVKNLNEIYDLERIIGRISYGNLSPKDLVQLKKSLLALPKIKKILEGMKGNILKEFSKRIEVFQELSILLEKSIVNDPPYLLRDGGVIKTGYSEELDNIVNISKINKEFLTSLEKREKEKTGIKSLKVGYNKVFGYYIEVTKANLNLVKDEFGYIRKQTTSNSERYITEELKEREALILRSDERSIELEIELFNEIRDICRTYSPKLQNVALVISELDMLTSLMVVSRENNYIRPEFSLYGELVIKEGRHPVIENSTKEVFIPNDITMYNDTIIELITGPNMSGKSTYMRQIALICIMAQIGCYVPATTALLPVFDKIFTRIGSSDDIASGESTFMSEMIEVNYALQNATCNSLIILDEVGRGTATYDGMALAQAIIEYIHEEVEAKTLFSTHYHELTSLSESLKKLKNVHVDAREENGNIVFLHKVLDNPSEASYGINVAKLAEIPQTVTLRAQDILNKLENTNKYETSLLSINNYNKPVVITKNDPLLEEIKESIESIDIDNMKPIEALNFILLLKEKLEK